MNEEKETKSYKRVKRVLMSVRLHPDTVATLKNTARMNDLSVGVIIDRIVRKTL